MNLTETERHAKALMTLHGVGHLAFEFARGKNQIGACHYKKLRDASNRPVHVPFKISLSKHFVVLLTDDEIRDVILHEIAHAIALQKGHNGHGPVWKAEARRLGANPKSCAITSASPEKSVKGWCTKCNKVVMQQHRMPLRVYFHRGCGLKRDDALVWFKNGERIWPNDMPARYRAEFNRLRG